MPAKKGTVVHRPNGELDSDVAYAIAIGAALRKELGTTHQAVKSAIGTAWEQATMKQAA